MTNLQKSLLEETSKKSEMIKKQVNDNIDKMQKNLYNFIFKSMNNLNIHPDAKIIITHEILLRELISVLNALPKNKEFNDLIEMDLKVLQKLIN